MLRSLKVATPATAATVVVPEREPPPGLCSIATVTLPVNVSTAFPSASRATTGTGGAMVAPAVGHGAVGSPGIRCGVKVTWVGARGERGGGIDGQGRRGAARLGGEHERRGQGSGDVERGTRRCR